MLNTNEVKKYLLLSLLLSLILLLGFFGIEKSNFKDILKLDHFWVLIAFLPLFITVMFSGIIKGFKGLGIELELSKTIEELNLNIPIELVLAGEGNSSIKDNQKVLEDLKEKGNLDQIKIIKFFLKKNNYTAELTCEYFKAFPNLEYIEIFNEKEDFQGLFYFSEIFKKCKECNEYLELIEEFLQNLKNDSLKNYYSDKYIVEKVKKSDTILDVYKQFKKSSSQVLPVIECNKMVGVVSRCQVNEQIAKKAIEKI